MLVDGVGRLGGRGVVEDDLEDDVDPGAVGGADDEGGVVGVGVGGGVWIEEQGSLVVGIRVVDVAAAEAPVVVRAQAAEFEDVGHVSGRGGLAGGVGDQKGFVERDDGGGGVPTSVIDVCRSVDCVVGGGGVVPLVTSQ